MLSLQLEPDGTFVGWRGDQYVCEGTLLRYERTLLTSVLNRAHVLSEDGNSCPGIDEALHVRVSIEVTNGDARGQSSS